MCGRFFVDAENREIDFLLGRLPEIAPLPKTGEVFPTENALVLTTGEKVETMAWGFPRRDGKGVIFNARSESTLQKPMFAKALRSHPAAIPTSGFYEWHAARQGCRKYKYFFKDFNNPILYLAGFWNFFDNESNPRHFTILTTAANHSMQPYHHRMPLLLKARDLAGWLDGSNLEMILHGNPEPLRVEKVSDNAAPQQSDLFHSI